MSVSERSQEIKPFIAMELLEKVQAAQAEGKDVISLALGEPDFEAPECVKEAAAKALKDNVTKYTHSQGLPELREEICRHYYEKYNVIVTPDQVIVSSGTSPALLLIFAALLNPGDEFILSDPHYPCYPSFISFLNALPIYVGTREEDGFQLSPNDVTKNFSTRTKGIMLTSPSNPTGTLMSADTMKLMASLGPYLVSDEIYHGLTYDSLEGEKAEEHSILEFTNRAFVINGFSKAYAMTGFRLGYAIVPHDFVRPMQVMQQNLFISANSFVQKAGIVALREAGPDVERMRLEFDRRRKVLLAGLKKLGFEIAVEPRGAFYVFANAKKFTNDSLAFSNDLFEKTGVAVTPGIDFGPGGEGYLRFSYANSLEKIEDALERIGKYLAQM